MAESLSQRIDKDIRELEQCLDDVPHESRETVWRMLNKAREQWALGNYISAQHTIDEIEEWFD